MCYQSLHRLTCQYHRLQTVPDDWRETPETCKSAAINKEHKKVASRWLLTWFSYQRDFNIRQRYCRRDLVTESTRRWHWCFLAPCHKKHRSPPAGLTRFLLRLCSRMRGTLGEWGCWELGVRLRSACVWIPVFPWRRR